MPQHPDLDLVVFDLGGVLIDIALTWDDAAARAGLAPRPVADLARFQVEGGHLTAQYQVGAIDTAHWYRGMADASGNAYTADEIERVLYAWSRRQFIGVERVFAAIEAAEVPTAVLTNTNEAHWARLAALHGGEPEYPIVLRAQYRFASHLLGVAKPDPRVFAAVSEATGAAPNRVLFFDDIEPYVLGARAAGWHAEHIDATRDTPTQLLRHLRAFGIVPLEDHHGQPIL